MDFVRVICSAFSFHGFNLDSRRRDLTVSTRGADPVGRSAHFGVGAMPEKQSET